VHDGFYGCGTGAGYANDAFLRTLVELLPEHVELVLLPVHLDPDSPERDPAWYDRTRDLVARARATVYPVHNNTDGRDRFGTLPNFRHLAEQTATVLRDRVLGTADPLVIIAFDVPFLGLSAALPRAVRPDVVLVPRSSGLIHQPEDTDRIRWETHSLLVAARHGTRIGAISRFMRHHLRTAYGVPDAALVDLPDGLVATDWALTPPEDSELPAPARSGFLLSFGRAEPYKGFADLLDAIAILRGRGRPVPHLVLAATVEGPGPTAYQRALAERIAKFNLDATLVTRFSPEVRRLLAHPRLRGVVVPSRAEPFGRIPVEAFAAGAAPVISTTAGGLAEQVVERITGFVAPPGDPVRLAAALDRALALGSDQLHQLRRRAATFAADTYDYRQTVQRFLTTTTPLLSNELA
jgi:glycosyltransferase involved in cell wall biosynthesis